MIWLIRSYLDERGDERTWVTTYGICSRFDLNPGYNRIAHRVLEMVRANERPRGFPRYYPFTVLRIRDRITSKGHVQKVYLLEKRGILGGDTGIPSPVLRYSDMSEGSRITVVMEEV